MNALSRLLIGLLVVQLVTPLPAQARSRAVRDRWVHPRGEAFDPERHYRDQSGEVYYVEERGIGAGEGSLRLQLDATRLRVRLASSLLGVAARTGGRLEPILLWDSDADGRVDRSVRGVLEGAVATIDVAGLEGFDPDRARWQLGVLYLAGPSGDAELDGRYLASVVGSRAHVARTAEPPELPAVAAAPLVPGLLISKHREGEEFDFAEFIERPQRFSESFDPLTRQADEDDWTVEGDLGRLLTHFDRDDLFLVRTTEGFDLSLHWGDLALPDFLERYLAVEKDDEGCYSTMRSALANHDGSPVRVPNRIYYCPDRSLALFDVPDGYEVGISALSGDATHERTEAGTSIADNVRLYVRQIYPNSPSSRATQTLGGNVRAGLRDAGHDVGDALLHALAGRYEQNIHTGQTGYRPSPVTAAPLAVGELLRGRPLAALERLSQGVESAVQAGADLVSAFDNALLNPLVQAGVGSALSLDAADSAGDWLGALGQAVVKNLPFGERSLAVVNPQGSWFHDRGYDPPRYTRTDTQLNIDRTLSLLDAAAVSGIHHHNSNGCRSGCGSGPIPLGGDQAVESPFPPGR